MPKSTPSPMKRTANATDSKLRCPTTAVANPAVQISPQMSITTVATTSVRERRPNNKQIETRVSDSKLADFAPSKTLDNSSVDSAKPPVKRTRTPFSGVNPSSSAILRIARIAGAAGVRLDQSALTLTCKKRRRSLGFGSLPEINERQESSRIRPSACASTTSAMRSNTTLRSPIGALPARMSSTASRRTSDRPRILGSLISELSRPWAWESLSANSSSSSMSL